MTDGVLIILLVVIMVCFFFAWHGRYSDYRGRRALTPGLYEVGRDIEPGRCDLIAESGSGHFTVKNRHIKDWNMGNPLGHNSKLIPARFRNLTLERGDILEINGNVTVVMAPPVPVTDLENETLGPGNYRFGVDVIPPARYDFEVASGTGEFFLIDVTKNTFNLYQDMAEGHPLRAKSFNNVPCSLRYELCVTGSLQLRLKRSEKQPFLMQFRKGI